MSSTLIRGKYVICSAASPAQAVIHEDAAVLQRDGRIAAIGPFAELARRERADEVLGSDRHVVLPGLINAHHHDGLTPFQLGSPDLPIEVWGASRLAARDVDPYLDTLYAALQMAESGITTVQHIQSRLNGPASSWATRTEQVIRAYRDVGLRVSYSSILRDQNRLVHEPDEVFIGRLPPSIKDEVGGFTRAQSLPVPEQLDLCSDLWRRWNDDERVRIQLAPANLHWCSDEALAATRDHAERLEMPIHLHLLETPYQRAYAHRRNPGGAVRHLASLGLLGSRLTIGHGVWLDDAEIELLAETGTSVCHCASSNLRLRSGIAPVNRLLRRGVRIVIGIDNAGLNDDRDMLQEMRLALLLHREPGIEASSPTACDVLRMATTDGAATTGFGPLIGALAPGKAADLVLIRWDDIAYPYLDPTVPVIDAIVQRAKSTAVETVIVNGEPILRDGRITKVNKEDVHAEIAATMRRPLRSDEARRRQISRQLLPYVRQAYAGTLNAEDVASRPPNRGVS